MSEVGHQIWWPLHQQRPPVVGRPHSSTSPHLTSICPRTPVRAEGMASTCHPVIIPALLHATRWGRVVDLS